MPRQPLIPWSAKATLGRKQRNGRAYIPELFALTLDEALEKATDPAQPSGTRICIWVNWKGRDIVLYQKQIAALASRPDRPERAREVIPTNDIQ